MLIIVVLFFFFYQKVYPQISNWLHVLFKRSSVNRCESLCMLCSCLTVVVFIQDEEGKNSNCFPRLNWTICNCYAFQAVNEGRRRKKKLASLVWISLVERCKQWNREVHSRSGNSNSKQGEEPIGQKKWTQYYWSVRRKQSWCLKWNTQH